MHLARRRPPVRSREACLSVSTRGSALTRRTLGARPSRQHHSRQPQEASRRSLDILEKGPFAKSAPFWEPNCETEVTPPEGGTALSQ